MRRHWCILSATLLLAAIGCSSNTTTTAIQGAVSFGGRQIEKGEINFIPVDGTPGASAVACITEGKYSVPGDKWGLASSGIYLVRITAFRKTGRKVRNAMEPGAPLMETHENYIPAVYNDHSTLKVRVSELPDKENVDFQLGKTSHVARFRITDDWSLLPVDSRMTESVRAV